MNRTEFDLEIVQIMTGNKGLSFSALKSFRLSPRHFYAYKMDKVTTKAMEEGIMFHMAILEPERFKNEYWVLDDSSKIAEIGGASPRATKAYKEWVISEEAKNPGKKRIEKADFDNFLSIGEYLTKCSATKELMSGLIEKEFPFEFDQDGFKINGRIDGMGPDYIIDLKKVANASFNKIKWVIRDSFYDMQGSIYCHAKNKKQYYLIFCDLDCNVTVVKLSEETLKHGFLVFCISLEDFRRCAEEDLWNSSYEFYNNGFIEV